MTVYFLIDSHFIHLLKVASIDLVRLQHVTYSFKNFSNFLESTKDGIEVSYNASGVLAHMLSDGETAWTVPQPCREEVIQRMTFAIKRWPLDSKRNINYRYEMDIFLTLKGATVE